MALVRGWKGISRQLGDVTPRTAMRYADAQGLRVRKLGRARNAPVIAETRDLERWLQAASVRRAR